MQQISEAAVEVQDVPMPAEDVWTFCTATTNLSCHLPCLSASLWLCCSLTSRIHGALRNTRYIPSRCVVRGKTGVFSGDVRQFTTITTWERKWNIYRNIWISSCLHTVSYPDKPSLMQSLTVRPQLSLRLIDTDTENESAIKKSISPKTNLHQTIGLVNWTHKNPSIAWGKVRNVPEKNWEKCEL